MTPRNPGKSFLPDPVASSCVQRVANSCQRPGLPSIRPQSHPPKQYVHPISCALAMAYTPDGTR